MEPYFCFHYVTILFVLMTSFLVVSAITNSSTDKLALLELKSHITFDPLSALTYNWSSSTSSCDWVGVTCGGNERVVALNLTDMGLVGTIPPDLGNLTHLITLNISGNNFHGYLPPELTYLSRLRILKLHNNDFSGRIPSWFGNLTSLVYIGIRNNSLTGSLPSDIGNLRNLQLLSLEYNLLSGSIPSSIFNLSSLIILGLGYNNLTGTLPDDMCKSFGQLEKLYISVNQLSGSIPYGLGDCKKLKVMSISYNKFTGRIPKSLGNLTMLTTFYMGYNDLEGEIPEEFGNLENLVEVDIEFSNLVGPIPTNLFNISTLEQLSLTGNNLSGYLPITTSSKVANLRTLRLGLNQLSGEIPSSISNLSNIAVFELAYNSFSGVIPTELADLKNVSRLNIAANNLTTDPSSSRGLSQLITSLTNLTNLKVLGLAMNPLNGVLPRSIGSFSGSLEQLFIYDNKLKGEIPQEIGNLSNTIYIILNRNEFAGSIPPVFGRVKTLQALNLDGNQLEGQIPEDLCSSQNLGELLLQGNMLSGAIPSCFGNLTSLRRLNLGSNYFISIPHTFWNLKHILEVRMENNSFSGSLPVEIRNMKALTVLDLSRNRLSGNLPGTIAGLENLLNFSLAGNELQGNIPESIGKLISLELLDLSDNKFVGVIPKSLEKLSHLKYLNVSFNRLQGEIPDGGPFANFSPQSFISNAGLCGASRFQVSPCETSSPHRSKPTTKIIMICVILGVALLVLVAAIVVIYRKRNKRSRKSLQSEGFEGSDLDIWRRVSLYELEKATEGFNESNLIGMGSFGSVYKGILSDGTHVAVKVFNLQQQEAQGSFATECEVLTNVRHRNLLKIISCCSNTEFTALILEYMPNGSLDKWLYAHNYFLDLLQRLDILIDVASALEYLHHEYSTPIVHCDLKPSNVLLDKNMVAHVADFGITKLVSGEDSMIQTKTLATIGYMAPEYGSEGIVSARVDVYSFGILMLETITRKRPTDEMFVDGMSMKRWVRESLPSGISEVADANLLRTNDQHFEAKAECISSTLELALNCCEDMPKDRLDMKQVLVSLKKIKLKFLKDTRQT